MNNAYQWVPFYEALTHTPDINHSDPPRFTCDPNISTRTLFFAGVNGVWKLTNDFYKCIKKDGTSVELEGIR